MAAIHQDGGFICGGTVIASRWVLTAGHCIGEGNYSVRVGSTSRSSGGVVIPVDGKVVHPQFDGVNFTNDAGLLHLAANAPVTPVTLAGPGDDNLEADGASATLVGWGDITPTLGLLASETLRQASVNIVGDANCFGETSSLDAQTNVCDSGVVQGQCNGDSGGPQLGRKNGGLVQIGIVSHSVVLLCGYANLLIPEASAEVNAPSIRNFISSTAGV
jgi:secreted trypsin-like serine protease